jgi:hypothetical protein
MLVCNLYEVFKGDMSEYIGRDALPHAREATIIIHHDPMRIPIEEASEIGSAHTTCAGPGRSRG